LRPWARDDKDRAATLPEGASPLFNQMFAATQRYVDRGTVCRDVYATRANRADARMLLDGPEIFTKVAEIVRGAKADVAIQTFVWENDSEAAKLLLDAIKDLGARRAADREAGGTAAPIRVRFLLDYFKIGVIGGGGKAKVEALLRSLRALNLDPRDISWEVGGYHHLAFGNLHVKTVVVDGITAMIQGANFELCHDRLGVDGQGPWRDSGYLLEGEVARGLLSDFDDAWMDSPSEIHGWNAAQAPDRARVAHTVLPLPAITNGIPMMIVTRERDANPFSNRDDNTQDRAFMAGFANAKNLIRVRTPNLNDDKAKAGLIDAVKRGVRVELVLSKGFNEGTEDSPGQGNGNSTNVRRMYQALATLEARGELPKKACELFKVRWHSRDGRTNLCGNGDFTSHLKYMSFDDSVAIVGTANMDTQSWNNSREVNVVVDDADTTKAWDARVITADFDKGIPAKECAADKPGVAESPCPKEDDVDETKPIPPPTPGVGAGIGAPLPSRRKASGTAPRTEGDLP
jgi:phosphatidylserine/phosphatidylglycerophosphate/cardiolipin synthase-like enzyme